MAKPCRKKPIRGRSIPSFRREKPPTKAHYADLSLAVIKLMGPGEYVFARAGDANLGHFALAAHDYTHSTAPNRRFADMVTQRLIKSVLAKQPSPYSDGQLDSIARTCTLREDAARKVERVMNKRIAAVALQHRIGETFSAVVTGVTPKGVTPVTTAANVSPDPALQRHGRNAFIHHAFHFARRILPEGAVPRYRFQLPVRVRRRLPGQNRLDEPLRHCIGKTPVRRGRMGVIVGRQAKCPWSPSPGRAKTYSPGPISLITASERSA